MKQKFTKKLFFGTILVFLVVFGCQRDDFDNHSDAESLNITVKHHKGSQAKTMISEFKKGVLSSTRFSLQSPGGGVMYRRIEEITIDENEVMEVRDSLGNRNYSFRVQGFSESEDNKFYNLVIHQKGGVERAFLMNHKMSGGFAEAYYSGGLPIEMFQGALFVTSITTEENPNPCDEDIVVTIIPQNPGGGAGGGNGSGNVGVDAGNGNGSNNNNLEAIQQIINQLAATSSSGCAPAPGECQEEDEVWEDCMCYIYVSVSPRYMKVGNFPVLTDVPDPCGEDIGTIGVLPGDNDDDNCQDLKDKSANGQFYAKMNELKNDANGMVEAGMVMFNTSPNYSQKEYGGIDSEGSPYVELTYDISRAGEVIGFMHCHLNTNLIKSLAVFSLSDFVAFGIMVENSNAGLNEFAMYVTSNKGTFAVKLTDKQAIIDLKNYIVNNPAEADKRFKRYVKHTKTTDKQVLGLLQFLNEKASTGIKLYQGDNNQFNNWEEKYLENKKVKSKNC